MIIATAPWKLALEVHPAGWHFPAGASWLAGWIGVSEDHHAADLRVWIDDRPFLGLPGLPKPGMDEQFLGRPGPPYTGFAVRVEPPRGARSLRLELRDPAGAWTEVFRTPITVAADAAPAAPPAALPALLETAVPALRRLKARHPQSPWAGLAREVLAGAIAHPLDTLPNPPFHGALEEPRAHGRVGYGRLTVTGWLAHRDARIVRLTALVDGRNETPLLPGLARTDVGAVFADLPGAAAAQFVGEADLPPGHEGPALLRIFAELDDGVKHLVFAQRFRPRVVAGPDEPPPAISRPALVRALWALRGAARELRVPAGPAGALAAAVRQAWSAAHPAAPVRPYRSPPPRPDPATPAPRRLLAVTHNLNFEGAPRLLFELLRHHALAPGTTVRVLSPADGPLRRLYEEAGMAVEIVDVAAALRAESPAACRAALADAVRINWTDVDLLIANALPSFWAVLLARAHGRPALFYIHESAPLERFFGPLLPPALLPLADEALRTATRVVFTAEASRAVFDPRGERDNFRVLPSWLDVAAIEAFAAAQPKDGLRARHGVDPAAVVVLNLGTVCARKGHHVFVRAAAQLEREQARSPGGPRVEFIMVGARPDPFTTALRQQVADAGLRHLHLRPETRDNLDWHRLADLLVCTSYEESSPRVLLEAAAFGTPIVSTDVNGIPELLAPDAARLIAPGDPHRLAAAVRTALAEHAAGDRRRAERARLAVVRRFDARVSLPQHAALAREALTARG